MTLAQDQTIASLSITNGYTLSGATNSITTTGNVSVASGAVLSIDNMNVGGAFTDSGSATFAGVLTINGGGQFTLSSGTLSGGINGTGTFETAAGTHRDVEKRHHLQRHDLYDEQQRDHRHYGHDRRQGHAPGERRRRPTGILDLTGATTLSGGGAVSLTTATGGGRRLSKATEKP